MYFKETQYGFEWGATEISRACSDDKKGWTLTQLFTPRYNHDTKHGPIEIYVTKTGKVRIYDKRGEWMPPKKGGK